MSVVLDAGTSSYRRKLGQGCGLRVYALSNSFSENSF
jgi:hypothetical protein